MVALEAFEGRVFDSGVHTFDLAIGPRMVWLREAVLDTLGLADHVEAHRPGEDGVAIRRLLGELDAIACLETYAEEAYSWLRRLKSVREAATTGLMSRRWYC